MARFIVIVLDGFGIGAMKDAKKVRPGDEKSNTLRSILNDYPDLKLTTLEKMGLMNAYGQESKMMHFNPQANFGCADLMHYGADTFMGHQEIMGTLPKIPEKVPFQNAIDEVKQHLIAKGHQVEEKEKEGLRYLLVDKVCTVADNIDADFGMAYNCTAPLDFMSFEQELKIGHEVREVVKVNRVIPFGGTKTTLQNLLQAAETREGKYVGIHAVKSGSYLHGYQCRHLGYGVDKTVQVPALLAKVKIPVSLFGKVADIVSNDEGKSISCVPTAEVLDLTLKEIANMDNGFICTNVQETDLAGHSQNAKWYKELLELADQKIGEMLSMLKDEDILMVMADHGNDPDIGHNRHTRENVPLLLYSPKINQINLGERKTLSDVGATVCDFFHANSPQNGQSFLNLLHK